MCDRVLRWESSQNGGNIRLLPRGTPSVFSPCLWEPQASLSFQPPLVLPYTPFPSLWRGVWMLGSPPPLPLFFTVPTYDLLSYRPRLVLKPEMRLHSL